MASHSLQAENVSSSSLERAKKDLRYVGHGNSPIHRSSPFGYLLNACSPRNRGESGPFSNGYMIVYGGRKNCSRTIHIPDFKSAVESNDYMSP